MPDSKSLLPFSCRNCGKNGQFKRSQLNAYKGAGQFCSRGCHYEYYRKHPERRSTYKGRSVDSSGYVVVRKSSGKGRSKQVREHRVVMEQHLERQLEPWEHVHHINGDKQDNRPENLELLSVVEHGKHHARAYREKFIAPVRSLYDRGSPYSRIAQELGIGQQLVVSIVRELGLPPRKPGRPRKVAGS